MREQILIRWPQHTEDSFSWVLLDAHGKAQGKILEGTLAACAASAAGRRVTVLVPSVDVLLSRARVPTKNRRRLLQALPYAMEEQLSEDIAELHFALGLQDEDGAYSVAVVAKAKMDAWLGVLDDAGVRPDAVVPEVLALPIQETSWSALIQGDAAAIRTGMGAGFGCDTESFPHLVPIAIAEAGESAPRAVELYASPDASSAVSAGELKTTLMPIEHPLQALLKGVAVEAGINLLQGAYSRRDQMQKLWLPWRAAAVVLGVWIILQGGLTLFEIYSMKQKLAAVDQQITQTFRATFPSIQRIVDPKLQMEQQLRALRGQGQQQGALGLLAGMGEVLQRNRDAQIKGVSFRDGRLDLELELKDLQSLDQIKQQAADRLKTSVEIVSAASQKEKVAGRLRIGGGT